MSITINIQKQNTGRVGFPIFFARKNSRNLYRHGSRCCAPTRKNFRTLTRETLTSQGDIAYIPQEIWGVIFTPLLNPWTLALVCKTWREVVMTSDGLRWRPFILSKKTVTPIACSAQIVVPVDKFQTFLASNFEKNFHVKVRGSVSEYDEWPQILQKIIEKMPAVRNCEIPVTKTSWKLLLQYKNLHSLNLSNSEISDAPFLEIAKVIL